MMSKAAATGDPAPVLPTVRAVLGGAGTSASRAADLAADLATAHSTAVSELRPVPVSAAKSAAGAPDNVRVTVCAESLGASNDTVYDCSEPATKFGAGGSTPALAPKFRKSDVGIEMPRKPRLPSAC